MHKTTTINLGGQVFNIDEDAYTLLKTYLDNIRQKLAKDEDQDEILKDFEQAVAEHLLELMTDRQTVVTKPMTKKVIDAIGDYETEADQAETITEKSETTENGWRGIFKHPIYASKQGAVIGGVCAGLAQSLEVDPFWVRLLFVILAFLTQGFAILIYIVLMLIMKEPKSLSDQLRAEGRKPTAAAFVAHSKERFQQTRNNIASTDFNERLRPIRCFLIRAIRLMSIIIASVAIVAISVASFLLVLAWFGHHNTASALSYVPRPLIYAAFSSAFFVLMLPFVLLLVVSLSRRAARASLTGKGIVMLLLPWLVAVGILTGSMVEAVPHLADWSRDHPKNPYFQLQVKDHAVQNFCLNLGGHCNDQFQCFSNLPTSALKRCPEAPIPPLSPLPIRSFDDCASYYPVLETFPEQCMVPGGPTFVNN